MVYRDLGCVACHTQQVRRPSFGNDQAQGWGERQSVARDYIHQSYPQLGAARIGQDLTNLAGRKPRRSGPPPDSAPAFVRPRRGRHRESNPYLPPVET